MNIRKIMLMTLLALILAGEALANNLSVSNVSLYKAPGQPAGTIGIKFDLSWDNSFSAVDNNGSAFFDRAWVFVKYFDAASPADTAWRHATLISGGTVGDYSAVSGTGISADKKGAFCRPGTNQVVYWNYGGTGGDGLAGTASFSVKVMAIEMVYVPQAAFYLGSGAASWSGESGSFTDSTMVWVAATVPFLVGSESLIEMAPVSSTPGKLWGTLTTGNATITSDGLSATIPAAYPKGYKGFYMMKYEITQGQYRDFLNTLKRSQQNNRVASVTADRYALANTAITRGGYTNSIIRVPTVPGSGVIVFGCDYDDDKILNESNDGEWLACNYLSWADLTAYADWAALRPMSEFEFEKACRGPMYPAVNEFPWGSSSTTTNIYTFEVESGVASAGITANFRVGTPNALNASSCTDANSNWLGVFRTGILAGNASCTSRAEAGASYYGIMELAGNVEERAVSVTTSQGRAFTGSHGDGSLDAATGHPANVTDWPSYSTATGAGARGSCSLGTWLSGRISDRSIYTHTTALPNGIGATRYGSTGGRLVRTDPGA